MWHQSLRRELIDGSHGNDHITGSDADGVIVGGRGNDELVGGDGDDAYLFAAGDGGDVIDNSDTTADSFDSLLLQDIDYDDVWLSREDDHLAVNVAASTDRVLIENWYANEESQIDGIFAEGGYILREQVDQLITAMAAFDVPSGVGADIRARPVEQHEPVLSSVWQLAA